MNLVVQRAQTQLIIDDDPWDITVIRAARTQDDAETTFTCVGSIKPSGARGAPSERLPSYMLPGMPPVGRYGWVLLAPWDTDEFKTRDSITAVQRSTSFTRLFNVIFSSKYAYKYEVIVDERE